MLPRTLALLWTLYCECCGGLCFPLWNVRKGADVVQRSVSGVARALRGRQFSVLFGGGAAAGGSCVNTVLIVYGCDQKLKHFWIQHMRQNLSVLLLINGVQLFHALCCYGQVSWGRVRKQTHTPVRKASLSSCHMIPIIPHRLKILVFLATTMLHCFPLRAWRPVTPNLRPVTAATSCPRAGPAGYLCIDTLVSMGTIASGFSFRSSHSRPFPSSSSSAPSSGFPLPSMCDAGKSTENAADCWRRLALTRSSSGETQV